MARIRIQLDLDGSSDLAEQLKQLIQRQVRMGEWKTGFRLPTVRQIAVDLELNANEVQRLCSDLTDQGFLMRREGLGTYSVDLRQETKLQPQTQQLIG